MTEAITQLAPELFLRAVELLILCAVAYVVRVAVKEVTS